MFGILIVIHIIACVGLIFFILIQSGKGGGLIDSFSSAESIFGTKTSSFLTKTTTTLAITFFVTCLSLAFLSVKQSKSIIQPKVTKQQKVTQETDNTVKNKSENQMKKEETKDSEQKNNAVTEEKQQK